MKKNVASQVVGAQLVSKTDGSNVTSGTTTVYVVGDGGTQATGSVGSGAATHEGHGFWTYAPAQAETNYDHVAFTFENSSAVTASVQIYTSFPQTGDNYARLGAPAGASVSADVAAVKAVLPSALVSGRIDASVGAIASGAITATSIANDAITDAKVASDVTIASVTGAVGSVTGSVGSVATGGISAASIAADTGLKPIRSGTAQAGASGSLTLDASASATSEIYDGEWLLLTGGTGAGQTRMIKTYNGSTKVATVATWTTTPDNTTTFAILPAANINAVISSGSLATGAITYTTFDSSVGNILKTSTLQGGSSTSITLDASASSVTDFYVGTVAVVTLGAGIGQSRVISAYNGTTKVATVSPAWATSPDVTSSVTIIPFGNPNGITGNVGGNVTGSVGSVASGGITSGSFAAGAINAAAIATDAIDADALAADAVTEIQSGLSTLNAAGVRTAVGLASANLDTQLGAIDDFVDTEMAAVKTVTDKLDTALESDGGVYRFTTNALEQAPTGGGTAPTVVEIADEVETRTIAAVTVVNGLAANSVTAAALAADAGTELAAAIWARVIDGSLTAEDLVALLAAVAVGKTTIVDGGGGAATVTFRNPSDTKDAVIATMADSERTAMTLDP